jgi:hypothetical protein
MKTLHDPIRTTGPGPPAIPRRWRSRSLVAGVIVVTSLAVTACGSSGSSAILNTGKLEHAIAQSSFAQRGQHAQVSCPSSVPQRKGLVFSCMAVVGHISTRFVVTEQNGAGHVNYEAR